MVTIRSPFRGYITTWCVEIEGRRFNVLFAYKLNQFGLRKCPHDHWLTNKAYKKRYDSNKNLSTFYTQNAGEKRRTWIWNKITSLPPYVYCLSINIIFYTAEYGPVAKIIFEIRQAFVLNADYIWTNLARGYQVTYLQRSFIIEKNL